MMLPSVTRKLREYLSGLQSLLVSRREAEPQQSPALLRLPAELQLEIIKHLDASSTINLKLSCRQLYAVIPFPPGGLDKQARISLLEQFPPRTPAGGVALALCVDCVKYHPPDWEIIVSSSRRMSGYARRGRKSFLMLDSVSEGSSAGIRCAGRAPPPGRRPLKPCRPCRRCRRYGYLYAGEIGEKRWPDRIHVRCHCERVSFILVMQLEEYARASPRSNTFWWTREHRMPWGGLRLWTRTRRAR